MIWQPSLECMDREELEQLQLERLEATLTRVHRNVPLYQRRFDEVGFDPDGLRDFADLRALPFTTKEDLRANYPYGLFAVPLREVVRLHASSGTTGSPTVVGYTRNDIRTWSDAVARVLVAGGVTKDDLVQIAFNYGLFTGAFGLHYGAERLGASVIPMSSGHTRRQIQLMQDFKTTALVATPSYALLIAETLLAMGVRRQALSLRVGLFGAEPWSDALRRELEARLEITASDNYGLSEVMGPGVAGECPERAGLHLAEDHFLVELVDPVTLKPTPPGQVGELVLTTLTREAFPVVRYRTRDLVSLLPGRCGCGRTLARMSRVQGRDDDVLIIKGVNVFPSQIETVLVEMEGTEPHWQVVVERRGALDEATVRVELSGPVGERLTVPQAQVREAIRRRLASELNISVEVTLLSPGTLDRTEGKARRVVDLRQK
jgi:phenylacetate-CoA ligase